VRRAGDCFRSCTIIANSFAAFLYYYWLRKNSFNLILIGAARLNPASSAEDTAMRLFQLCMRIIDFDEDGPLLGDAGGATAIEYGLIAALIAVAAVVVMGTVGTNLTSVFSTVANSL
jgi:pilus assembly protein Flp/PilA